MVVVVIGHSSTLLPILLLLLLLKGGGHRGGDAVAVEAAHWPKVRVVRVRVGVVLTWKARYAEGAKGSGAEGTGGEAQLLDFRFLQALFSG